VTTAFLDITAAVVAILNAAPAVSETILQANDRHVPESKVNALNVYHAGSKPEDGAIYGAPIDWTTGIVIECYAKTSTETSDVAVDPLIKAVYGRLASDRTLGGLVEDIGVPTIQMDYDSKGQRTGWAVMKYPVEHRTSNNTLESTP
jgi:hypothetical protein